MEFFATAKVTADVADLQREVRVDSLPEFCASVDRLLAGTEASGEIYCVWGQFRVNRELIRNGVRFTLPSCLNGVQWTVTADPGGCGVLVHCTINRPDQEPDFVDSLERFVADWQEGLEEAFAHADGRAQLR